jgi:glyoxylase-like metal-dependent hydrolase (beta-lactamase superfamily II)
MESLGIQTFFDEETSTFTYIIWDTHTKAAAIIDPVIDYDQYWGKTQTNSANKVIAYIQENNLKLEWILETHIHADHLTASSYIKEKLGGKIGIGEKIKSVLKFWVPLFNNAQDTPLDGSQFDHLFLDNETFLLGKLPVKVINIPGHTLDCCGYLIEDAIFVGDSLFMPDIGTARTDFPGGSAAMMYDSIQRILSLPDETRIFTCHDYPPPQRNIESMSTVKEQKETNVLINAKISKNDYIDVRNQKDHGKKPPKLLFPAIQFNLRAGSFGNPENNGVTYIKIPIHQFE